MGIHKQFYKNDRKKHKNYNFYLKHRCSCQRSCCSNAHKHGENEYVERLSIGGVCLLPHTHRTHSHRSGGAWRITDNV